MDGIKALLGLAAAAAVLALVHRVGRRTSFWLPFGTAWIGAGSLASWGLWSVVNILSGTVLATGAQPMPLVNLQALGEFLSGLLLGVAALFLLVERGHEMAEPAARPPAH